MNRYRLLAMFLLTTLVLGSALPVLSSPGDALLPLPASQETRALTVAPDGNGGLWAAWKGRITEGKNSRLRILVSHWEASRAAWTAEAVAGAPLAQAADEEGPLLNVDPIPNTYLAFGDSITLGGYAQRTYPERLNDKLNLRVAISEVINSGMPGEKTQGGKERITGQVSTYRPEYVLILEGTNDVTEDKIPSDVYNHVWTMLENARETAGVDNVKVMIATVIPRLDYKYDATWVMNQEAIIPAANDAGVPICDLWQAFHDFGPWQLLFPPDDKEHPNDMGLQLIADTFYDCMLAAFPEFQEETTPPDAWIESVPASVECGETIPVSWDGSDNLNWVVDYDVQTRLNSDEWADWISATVATTDIYSGSMGGLIGDVFSFRVRGRDLVGNEGDYGAPAQTSIADSVPPYEAHVNPLPSIQLTPFSVSWWASDACADVVAYDVQYRVGTDGAWQDWLTGTLESNASFDPPDPQSGEIYYFRVRAQDAAGNWGDWSDAEAFTELVVYSLGGYVYNIRHQPVVAAEAATAPTALQVLPKAQGGFLAHLGQAANYDVSVDRADRYGSLPTTYGITVDGHINGPDFVLPPQDDVVTDGDFEAGGLTAWQLGGSAPPALTATAHSGLEAVQFNALGHDSSLVQVVIPGSPLGEPTLSLMVRLAEAGPASILEIQLAGTGVLSPPLTYTIPVKSAGWTHVWRDLPGPVGEPLTLTLGAVDATAVFVDEIRLGSSVQSGYPVYLPILLRE